MSKRNELFGFKLGENVFILKRRMFSEEYDVLKGVVSKVGSKRLTITYDNDGGAISVFTFDSTLKTDDYRVTYRLFHTEKECDTFINKRNNYFNLKTKVSDFIKKSCSFEEIEAIYLYLEERHPGEI